MPEKRWGWLNQAAHSTCLAVAAALSWGCASTEVVDRAYDAHIVAGRSVPPQAYASYLRGVIAEVDGNRAEAVSAYREVMVDDPGSVEAEAHFHGLSNARGAPFRTRGDRVQAIAQGLAGDAHADAWDAVFDWAEGHSDVALMSYSLTRLLRRNALLQRRASSVVERFAGEGELGAARCLAAAVVESDFFAMTDLGNGLVAELAVDDAIALGDSDLVRERASRVRLGLADVAARALLAGRPEVARDLASERARAEPTSPGARLVLASLDLDPETSLSNLADAVAESISAAVYVAFGTALMRRVPPAEARLLLQRIPHAALPSGDDLIVRAAVGLASRRLIALESLPPDGLIEIAARYGTLPPTPWSAESLDLRHRYLALALSQPRAEETKQLRRRLAGAATRDPLVAAASAWILLGTDATMDRDAARNLLALRPTDPVLAAAALRLARRSGDTETEARARAWTTMGQD